MIVFTRGDIFESNCEALVNPVNCVGAMGGGIAKEFKERFPEMFETYWDVCKAGHLKPGGVLLLAVDKAENDNLKFIACLATKNHWKNPSQIEWVTEGIRNLAKAIKLSNIRSVAIPALGCGCGGLNWNEIKPVIKSFGGFPENVNVLIYEPL